MINKVKELQDKLNDKSYREWKEFCTTQTNTFVSSINREQKDHQLNLVINLPIDMIKDGAVRITFGSLMLNVRDALVIAGKDVAIEKGTMKFIEKVEAISLDVQNLKDVAGID